MSVDITLLSFFASPVDGSYRGCLSRTFGSMTRGSMRRAIFGLFFSILSPGCLVLPLSLEGSSIVYGLVIILLGYLVSFISLRHLSIASYKHQIFDYYTLCYHVLGRFWGYFIGTVMILHWLLLAAAYQSLLSYFIPSIYNPFPLKLDDSDEKLYALVLLNVFVIFPVSMCNLEKTISVKIITALGILVVMIVNLYGFISSWPLSTWKWFSNGLACIPTVACVLTSYSGYYHLPGLYNNLYEPTPKRATKVLFRSLTPLACIYCVLTVFVYAAPSHSVKNWIALIGEMIIGLNLTAVIPSTIATLRTILLDMIEYSPGTVPFVIITLVLIFIPCGVAIAFDGFIILFSALGVINSFLMIFVPGKKYSVLLNTHWTRSQKVEGVIYACFVMITCCIGFQAAVVL